MATITKRADLLFVVMEWLFVASRVAHAYVFTTRTICRCTASSLLLEPFSYYVFIYVGDLRAPDSCRPLEWSVMRINFL